MQECFSKYPAVYNKSGDDENDEFDAVMNSAGGSEESSTIDSVDPDQIDESVELENEEIPERVAK